MVTVGLRRRVDSCRGESCFLPRGEGEQWPEGCGGWAGVALTCLKLYCKLYFLPFLLLSGFNLLICLCFTLLNLSSLTLLMKSWHCSNLTCEMIEASLALHFLCFPVDLFLICC